MVGLGSPPHFMLLICYVLLVIKIVWIPCTTCTTCISDSVFTCRLAPGTGRTLSMKEIVYGKLASVSSWLLSGYTVSFKRRCETKCLMTYKYEPVPKFAYYHFLVRRHFLVEIFILMAPGSSLSSPVALVSLTALKNHELNPKITLCCNWIDHSVNNLRCLEHGLYFVCLAVLHLLCPFQFL